MSRYLSLKETANLVRGALKVAHPGTKFSVRSNSFAGGTAIDVSWTDGPTQKSVDAILHNYAGERFDGMVDMAYSVTHYLLPDGTAVLAESPGTEDQKGSDPAIRNFKPHPDAERVRMGAKYVHSSRQLSDDFIATCQRAWDAMAVQEQCDFLNKHAGPFRDDADVARLVARNVPAPTIKVAAAEAA